MEKPADTADISVQFLAPAGALYVMVPYNTSGARPLFQILSIYANLVY